MVPEDKYNILVIMAGNVNHTYKFGNAITIKKNFKLGTLGISITGLIK